MLRCSRWMTGLVLVTLVSQGRGAPVSVWFELVPGPNVVELIPQEQFQVALGTDFELDIMAEIPDPVVGWGLDLIIEVPEIVSIVADPANPQISSPPWLRWGSPDGDGLAGATLDRVSGLSVPLATVTFSADEVGETDLRLETTPGDRNEGFALYPAPSNFAPTELNAAQVKVVPEPSTVALLAIGAALAGLGALRRLRTP